MTFRQRTAAALKDTFLKEALTIATTRFIGLRREAFTGFPEGEGLRDRARQIKEATLQHLDRYLEQLVENVERRGGQVHYAVTADEARDIVLDLSELTFLDSGGIHALIRVSRLLDGRGRLIIQSPSAMVARVLEIVGADGFPNFEIRTVDRLIEPAERPTGQDDGGGQAVKTPRST